MADNPDIRGAQDRSRINMNQDHEVRYWTQKFSVTKEQLQQAVSQAGPMADDVERRLRGGSRSGTQ
jgi:hypothetical protein